MERCNDEIHGTPGEPCLCMTCHPVDGACPRCTACEGPMVDCDGPNPSYDDSIGAQCGACGVGTCVCKRCVGLNCEEQDDPSFRARECSDEAKRVGLNQCDFLDEGRGMEMDLEACG